MATKQNGFKAEPAMIADLKPHPRNYRQHPDDQLDHIIASIKEHGFYRNIVIARDGTILAGHGVAQAARKMGLESVPVIRLDVDPESPRALKLLTGDNEISHLVENDDRLLSELLKEIKDFDVSGLIGTGYDEMMLANLVMVTRPASEIEDFDEAAAWVGMPEYEEQSDVLKVIVSFESEGDRSAFMDHIGAKAVNKKTNGTWSIWWPEKEKESLAAKRFEG